MSEFLVYLRLGFEHIADVRGYDHILFVVALTILYAWRQWREVVILVTAFTVGHSVTLVLATLDLVRLPSAFVEAAIAATILLTALLTVLEVVRPPLEEGAVEPRVGRRLKYGFALLFGFVHGMGFSGFLRAALGSESSILVPLLGFNVGLEVGQLMIVALVLTANLLLLEGGGVSRRGWVAAVSGVIALAAGSLLVQRVSF